jgi:hypothetical protein
MVAPPEGQWRWKDADGLETAVRLAVFSHAEASQIQVNGQRAITQLDGLIVDSSTVYAFVPVEGRLNDLGRASIHQASS